MMSIYDPDKFATLQPLTKNLPPVLFFCSLDFSGAGGQARHLLECLHAAGVRVSMISMWKESRCPLVGELRDAQTNQPLWFSDGSLRGEVLKNYPERPAGLEMFSLSQSLVNLGDFSQLINNAGIIHLHWIAGLVGFPAARSFFLGKPIVWTMHDMNPFTGGCHYTAGCESYACGGCKNCPQLGAPVGDFSEVAATNFASKQTGYAGLDFQLVPTSNWLKDCAAQSLLLKNPPSQVIPTSIDLETFAPRPRECLPRKTILFLTDNAYRLNKGFLILREALKQLGKHWRGELPELLIVGNPPPAEALPKDYDCRVLGSIESREKLAEIYNAADIFISPSLQENNSTVIIEAQACGTPSIAFTTTGSVDIIQDSLTGYLVKHPGLPFANGGNPATKDLYRAAPEKTARLAKKIAEFLSLPEKEVLKMRQACRANAEREYHPLLQTERYLRLYRKILGLAN